MRRESGHSLMEVLIASTVAATLGAAALPGMRAWLQDSRQASRTTAFVVSAQLARSEALRRMNPVTLCASADGRRCGEDYSEGWIVFEDSDGDGQHQAAEPLLDDYRAPPGGATRSTRVKYVWRAYGRRSTNGTVIFCSPTEPARSRAVIVSYTGRPRTSDRLSGGQKLGC